MKKRTVSIKRTVWEIFLMTLLNVPYDPKIKTIIALSYRTYNRVFRVSTLLSKTIDTIYVDVNVG